MGVDGDGVAEALPDEVLVRELRPEDCDDGCGRTGGEVIGDAIGVAEPDAVLADTDGEVVVATEGVGEGALVDCARLIGGVVGKGYPSTKSLRSPRP